MQDTPCLTKIKSRTAVDTAAAVLMIFHVEGHTHDGSGSDELIFQVIGLGVFSRRNSKHVQTSKKHGIQRYSVDISPVDGVSSLYRYLKAQQTSRYTDSYDTPPAWSVKTLRASSRHCRDARVHGHIRLRSCMIMSTPPPSLRPSGIPFSVRYRAQPRLPGAW